MKKRNFQRYTVLILCAAAAALAFPCAAQAAQNAPSRTLNIGFANFKTIVEHSKIGKQEQAKFDGMKKQMETILAEKEKGLNEMATKFNDVDYLDTLSPEAETELKRKFRAQSQEYQQQQSQYYQTLQQANYKILEELAAGVAKAAGEVAKENKLDAIFNQEGAFYHSSELDVSLLIVAKLDAAFDKDEKEKEKDNKDVKKDNKDVKEVTTPVNK